MTIRGDLFLRIGRIAHNLPAVRGRTRAFLELYRLLGLGSKHLHVTAELSRPVKYVANLDLHSWLQRIAFLTGGYEEDTVRFLARLWDSIERPGYCLDVGANIGLIAIPLALTIRPRGKSLAVVAVEAVSDNSKTLAANVAANGLQARVRVLAVAVGEMEKLAQIQVEGDLKTGGGTGTANILPEGSDYACVRQDLKVRTLDGLVADGSLPPECRLVKIDTDGYDLKVLEGAASLMATDRPIVFGEFSAHCLAWHGQSLRDVLLLCERRGYQAFKRQGGAWEFSGARPGDPFEQDLLLVPDELVPKIAWCLRSVAG